MSTSTSKPSPASAPDTPAMDSAPAAPSRRSGAASALVGQWPGAQLCEYDPSTLDLLPGDQEPVDEAYVEELAESICVLGQLAPIHVRLVEGGAPQILAGRHRAAACARLGRRVQAIVHRTCDQDLADKICVNENEHRREASAYYTAVRLNQLRNRAGCRTAQDVAAQTGVSLPRVKLYLSIFNGSDKLLEAFRKHRLPVRLVAELVRHERQCGIPATRRYLAKAVAGELTIRELQSKRTSPRRAAPRTNHDAAWSSVAKRVASLATKDPGQAVERLRALQAEVADLLQTLTAETAGGSEAGRRAE